MAAEGIISGQRVAEEKLRLARELRRRMTPEERILWAHLRGNRLQGLHFRRQQVIDGFVVDLYCHTASLVVEVDGGIHRTQIQYDAERDRALAERGLRILRIPNEDVTRDLQAVLARIALAAEMSAPGSALEGPADVHMVADDISLTARGLPYPRHGTASHAEAQPARPANSPATGER